jgi:hypothetical protein
LTGLEAHDSFDRGGRRYSARVAAVVTVDLAFDLVVLAKPWLAEKKKAGSAAGSVLPSEPNSQMSLWMLRVDQDEGESDGNRTPSV